MLILEVNMWTWLALYACIGAPKGERPSSDSAHPASGDSTEETDSGPDSGADDDTGTPPEDCANGADDDRDGLLDCEDDDCELAAGCYEADCTDTLDDDEDGAVDCEDDDCWSEACEGSSWARVTDGQLTVRHKVKHAENHYFGGTGYCGFDSWEHLAASDTWVAQASGTVRFVQSGVADECTWSAHATGRNGQIYRRTRDGTMWGSTNSVGSYLAHCTTTVSTSFRSSPVTFERDLSVEPGCALSRSDFLPVVSGLWVYAPGGIWQGATLNTPLGRAWYGGPLDASRHSASSTLSSAFSEAFSRMEPLDLGAVYPTGP